MWVFRTRCTPWLPYSYHGFYMLHSQWLHKIHFLSMYWFTLFSTQGIEVAYHMLWQYGFIQTLLSCSPKYRNECCCYSCSYIANIWASLDWNLLLPCCIFNLLPKDWLHKTTGSGLILGFSQKAYPKLSRNEASLCVCSCRLQTIRSLTWFFFCQPSLLHN